MSMAIFLVILYALCLFNTYGFIRLYGIVSPKNKPEIDSGLKCPYCKVTIVGVDELDKINHMQCISMSELDLKQIQARPKDEYFPVYSRKHRDEFEHPRPSLDLFDYEGSTGKFFTFEWELYRNGQVIDSGFQMSKAAAEKMAAQSQTLDEHKRRTIGVSNV